MIRTFTEAVQTVDFQQAIGKPQQLWIEFAKLYEGHGQLDEARRVFDRAVQQPFRRVDDLADVWCAYAEMEIRNKSYKLALSHLRRATAVPPRKRAAAENGTVQARIHRSLKLWSMYADLEESLGTFEVRACCVVLVLHCVVLCSCCVRVVLCCVCVLWRDCFSFHAFLMSQTQAQIHARRHRQAHTHVDTQTTNNTCTHRIHCIHCHALRVGRRPKLFTTG